MLFFLEDAFESAACRCLKVSTSLLNAAGSLFGACFYYNLMILCLQSVVSESHCLWGMPIMLSFQLFEKDVSDSQGIVYLQRQYFLWLINVHMFIYWCNHCIIQDWISVGQELVPVLWLVPERILDFQEWTLISLVISNTSKTTGTARMA